jgi:hypothetical protein
MKNKKQSMTCIAAIKQRNGKIAMAADRRASWDFSQAQAMPRPKIQKRDGIIMAGTGDCYLISLIIDLMAVPEVIEDTDIYMYELFYDAVVKLLIRKRFCDEHKVLKIPKESNAEIIVAVSNKLFSVIIDNPEQYNDYPNGMVSIGELNLPYASGCGGALAWGSLLTTEPLNMKVKERLLIALNVAAQVSPGCDDKVDIEIED